MVRRGVGRQASRVAREGGQNSEEVGWAGRETRRGVGGHAAGQGGRLNSKGSWQAEQ